MKIKIIIAFLLGVLFVPIAYITWGISTQGLWDNTAFCAKHPEDYPCK
jgi:hypothetical protein